MIFEVRIVVGASEPTVIPKRRPAWPHPEGGGIIKVYHYSAKSADGAKTKAETHGRVLSVKKLSVSDYTTSIEDRCKDIIGVPCNEEGGHNARR